MGNGFYQMQGHAQPPPEGVPKNQAYLFRSDVIMWNRVLWKALDILSLDVDFGTATEPCISSKNMFKSMTGTFFITL